MQIQCSEQFAHRTESHTNLDSVVSDFTWGANQCGRAAVSEMIRVGGRCHPTPGGLSLSWGYRDCHPFRHSSSTSVALGPPHQALHCILEHTQRYSSTSHRYKESCAKMSCIFSVTTACFSHILIPVAV